MTNKIILPCDVGDISDGYHTFNELYEHRMLLFCALMNCNPEISWKSHKHEDGSMFKGKWFIAGMELPTGSITYHLSTRYWQCVKVKELEFAPKWDGHNSGEVLIRLLKWLIGLKN